MMTTFPAQSSSFPGLTGESRKALDARLRPAEGMTRKRQGDLRVCHFNNETLNNLGGSMKEQQKSFSPNYAIPPGETLRETLNSLGMTRAELGKRTGLSQQVIKEIVRGEASISTGMAPKLEQALGIPAFFWINLEKNYQKSMDRPKEKRLPG
jgi:addiction module HigA family antidote